MRTRKQETPAVHLLYVGQKIASSILCRANAVSLGMEVLDDNNDEPISNNTASTSDRDLYQIPLEARHDSRNSSTLGVKRRRKMNDKSAQMLNTVCLVANKFSVLADAITNQSSMNVKSIVREEVQKAMAYTNESIHEIKTILHGLAKTEVVNLSTVEHSFLQLNKQYAVDSVPPYAFLN